MFGMIFLTPSILHLFDNVWVRYTYKKFGFRIELGPNSDFGKGKLVISPNYFLSYFKDLLGVKTSLQSVLEKLLMFRASEKREEKKEKGDRSRIHQEWQDCQVEFFKGDPYKGMWDLFVLGQFTHTPFV